MTRRASTTTARRAKTRHDLFPMIPTEDVRVSPENEKLYRPVCPDDFAIQDFAKGIAKLGVKEPLVLSVDGWLLSGHRRLMAAKVAGLEAVPYRIDPAANRAEDLDGFLVLLREYNRQRHKTFDEAVREDIIDVDAADGSNVKRSMEDSREVDASRVVAGAMDLGERRRRAEITEAKRPFLDAILAVLEDRRDFWPVSDRQIHYGLLNNPPLIHAGKPDSLYRNLPPCYKSLTDLLTRARLVGLIPMDCIIDSTRPVTTWQCWREPQAFVHEQLGGFLAGYARGLMQSQPVHVEIIGEKLTIASMIKTVAMEFRIPVTIGRGYCSLPPRAAMVERFRKSGLGKLVLLTLSDHDPDGEEIAVSFPRSLRDDFDIPEASISAVKVALTSEQVERFQLPPNMLAKQSSRHIKKFNRDHGRYAYELEALDPRQLQDVLREAVLSVIDVDLFNHEQQQEQQDAVQLETLRRKVRGLLQAVVPDGKE